MGLLKTKSEQSEYRTAKRTARLAVKGDIPIEIFLRERKESYVHQMGFAKGGSPKFEILEGGAIKVDQISKDQLNAFENTSVEHPLLLSSVAQPILDRKSRVKAVRLHQRLEELQTKESEVTYKIRELDDNISGIDQKIHQLILNQKQGGTSVSLKE